MELQNCNSSAIYLKELLFSFTVAVWCDITLFLVIWSSKWKVFAKSVVNTVLQRCVSMNARFLKLVSVPVVFVCDFFLTQVSS